MCWAYKNKFEPYTAATVREKIDFFDKSLKIFFRNQMLPFC